MTTSVLMGLDARLDSEEAAAVLAAAWDAFGVAAELCDGITFEESSDELQAMVAAQQCVAGQALLPLPETGGPVAAAPPGPGAAGLDPYVRLLEHVSGSLTRVSAAGAHGTETAQALVRAAELAAGAAVALAAVRER
ncbi:hypothetical protein ACFWTC_38630 [Streptomyces sp. NPDC058619]|uniref:hypothetical protein n=1 Tax=unclassified Streptomyces TaxID=2593676 RepID=UPI00365B4BBE